MSNVAQTFEERVIAALASIETTLNSLNSTVNAEGGGLVNKFLELEKKVITLETKLASRDSVLWRVMYVAAWIVTTLIASYNLIQNLKR